MPDLPHGSLSFSIVPEQQFSAPAFDGSMLRGGFGHALKRLVCVMRQRECAGCPLERGCLYIRIFETRSASGEGRRFSRPPHPFVLTGNLYASRGMPLDKVDFRIRLFGAAMQDAPFVARAIEEAARRGFGPDRTPFRLDVIKTGTGTSWHSGQAYPDLCPEADPPAVPERVRLRFVTPVRLTHAGKPMDVERLDGPSLGRAILRRVSLMTSFHGQNWSSLDWDALATEAGRVRMEAADLSWRRLVRRSARQKAKQAIGGLLGEVTIDFRDAPHIRDLARWLPVLHLGKGSSMGLGQIEVAGHG